MRDFPRVTRRPFVIAAVMASMAMVALEATIVSTAMPGIVTELGGLHLYSWVFSSFLLAQTATTVVFGKLADTFGRKPTILAGIAIFGAGSVLAGCAWSMPSMIAFRVLQGLGAGAILPVTLTIVGDLYKPLERGKIQGYLASVWAVSAVAGPMAGSLIVQELSWAWIFWINVPVGLLAAFGFVAYLHEPARVQVRGPIDFAGAVLFTVAVVALMLGLTDVSTAASGARVAAEFGIFVLSTAVFLWHERRTPDPMVSLRLWASRPIAACNAANLLSSMALIGLTTFLPMYLQAVSQRTPVVAGLALTVMMVGWPAGATLCARTFHRVGLWRYLVGGSAVLPVGAIAFVLMRPDSSPLLAAAGSLVMGFGMGLLSVASVMLIQSIVVPSERGGATASNLFARNLGNTLGAALFGAVQGSVFVHSPGGAGDTSEHLRQLLGAKTAGLLENGSVREALHHSLHVTFWTMLVIAFLTVVAMAMVPRAAAAIRMA
ncbi:MAG: MDR family MFS transporter [Pseudomonadota bacterium]